MNAPSAASTIPRRRPRTLALELVDALAERIRDGRLATGDKLPTEAAVMAEFGVSRTVVREAISKLQASGLVETRHGVGTFVLGMGEQAGFRIAPEQMATLNDVIAVLELRIGVETEAAGLAAQRRTAQNLAVMRAALDEMAAAVEGGQDAVQAEHESIYDALAAQDADAARAAMRTHLANSRERRRKAAAAG